MARGDAAGSTITSVAAAGNLDFQPAAGVEVMWMPTVQSVSAVDHRYFDGTNESLPLGIINADYTQKAILTNSIYARIANDAGSAVIVVIRGIQTK